jgi:ectoine hydroxylase-related dioxygenase (phytanoyl-CoA dioxygenase family)
MSEENGTVHVLPFSRSGIRSWVQHIVEDGSNDKVGYFGDDPGLTAVVPAGSIVAFTSINFHCSGANTTNDLRRAYLGQYSAEPLLNQERTALWGNAEPFVREGRIVVGESPPDLPHRSELMEKG